MPEKCGPETTVEIRMKFPEIVKVTISGGEGLGQGDHLLVATKIGGDHVLVKPCVRDELLTMVSGFLSRKPQSEESAAYGGQKESNG